MDLCFPPHAEANVILGADALSDVARTRPHWRAEPFGGMDLAAYFDGIDFMVYFTAPTFRESFGRVLAEAIAAGKVVLTDPDTAAVFGDAVIATRPEEVDDVIAGFIAAPDRYAAQVHRAQARLADFSAAAFLRRQADIFAPALGRAA
jgi:glycosyltransferase involved in cell wall biosynthesis